jgi:hypothetical protein
LTGFKSVKPSMRSFRIPFSRFLYIGGKRLIKAKPDNPPETP